MSGRPAEAGGEERLVQTWFAPLAASAPGAFGLLDDCAVLAPRAGCDIVVTTDAVAEGVHFFPDDPARDIGWKALAVNVSDLAAKGARPLAYVLALAMPEPRPDAWMRELAAGLGEAQSAFGCPLIGGDTDRRPGPLSLAVTAFGEVPSGAMVRRATARPGDDLYVTGTLGDAALGLLLRRRPELAEAWRLTPAEACHLADRYLRPRPRLLGDVLRRHALAAMDISDGLAKDLGRMARASGLAARVEVSLLPLSPAARAALGQEPTLIDGVVAGGDDYEVLCAVPPGAGAAFVAETASLGIAVARIGGLAQGRGVALVGADGATLQLDRDGWDHF